MIAPPLLGESKDEGALEDHPKPERAGDAERNNAAAAATDGGLQTS